MLFALPQALMTQASLKARHTTRSTPFALISEKWSRKPGRCLTEHPGVNAPVMVMQFVNAQVSQDPGFSRGKRRHTRDGKQDHFLAGELLASIIELWHAAGGDAGALLSIGHIAGLVSIPASRQSERTAVVLREFNPSREAVPSFEGSHVECAVLRSLVRVGNGLKLENFEVLRIEIR